MPIIKLKHMARELDVDPYKLRCMLRAKFGKAKDGSWSWPERNKDYLMKLEAMKSNLRRPTHGEKK